MISENNGKHRVRLYKDHPQALVQGVCPVVVNGQDTKVRFVVCGGSVYVKPSGEFASLFGGRDAMLSKYGKTRLHYVSNKSFKASPDDMVHDGEFVLLAAIERVHRGTDVNTAAWARIREQADRDALLRTKGDVPEASKVASKRWADKGPMPMTSGHVFLAKSGIDFRPMTLAEKVKAKIAAGDSESARLAAALAELKALKTEVMEAYTMEKYSESLAALEIIAERIATEGGVS
jgi:hypothetical protein